MSTDPVVIIGLARTPMGAFQGELKEVDEVIKPVHRRRRSDRDGAGMAVSHRDIGMTIRSLALAGTLAFVAACATLENPADEQPAGREQTIIEMRAIVIGVDQKHRLLALQGEDGGRMVLPVAEEFRDFESARVGDEVVVSHTEAIAWQVKPSDKGAPGVSTSETLRNPKPGEAPGGTIERALTITATITAFDLARGTVRLTGPQGKSQTFRVHRRADMDTFRVGDLVEITYSEAFAVAVRPEVKK